MTPKVRSSFDHTLRVIDPPRELDAWERLVIERIVSWPETSARPHSAVEGIRVRADCTECATVFLASDNVNGLLDADGDPFYGYGVFPGELWFGAGGSEVHVLLHIADGRFDELQVYRADGQPASERPDADAMHLGSV